jgi:protein-S-isoprenylcysteine O-methyltransferase Ste14
MLRILSWIGLLTMAGGLVGLYFARGLFFPLPAVIAVQAVAVLLMLWARMTFGRRSFHAAADPTRGGLVTTGPYRFIRHPIYTAACLFGWPGAVAAHTPAAAALAALLTAGALVRMLCEEHLLVGLYPEYRDYAVRTKRMIPYVF